MGMIFKDFENKWVKKGREQGIEQGLAQGREQEYKRITEYMKEQADKQGIDYTPPPPPERTDKD